VKQTGLQMVQIDLKAFAKAIKFKRETQVEWSIQKVADKMQIGKTTLFRMECAKMPELNNYAKACYWLAVPMESFFVPIKKLKSKSNTKKQ
jgi:transcriptional regulator with XRE-family HTH domain